MNITPYEHQKRAFDFASTRDFTALFMETGTGKTLVAFMLMEFWHSIGLRKFIVVMPNTLTGPWLEEAAKRGFGLRIARLESKWPAAKKVKFIAEGEWDVLALNYEALRTEAIEHALVALRPQVMIDDEIQNCKNAQAIQTKAVRRVAAAVLAAGGPRVGMSGTPVVHSPLDLFSEFDVLRPSTKSKDHPLGYGNYWAFERGVCDKINHPYVPHAKIYEFPDDKLEELKRRVAPLAFEATKDECLDLPPRTFQVVELEMEDEQRRIYEALRADYVAFLDGVVPPSAAEAVLAEYDLTSISKNPKALEAFLTPGPLEQLSPGEVATDDQADKRISVQFATTLMIRCQQIASGILRTDDGVERDIPNVKLKWLREMLPSMTALEGDHKVIIFCRFKRDIQTLAKLCRDLKIGYRALTGTPNPEDPFQHKAEHSQAAVGPFQDDPGTRVFIGNLAVASEGITLTRADYMVYYNNSFTGKHRSQSMDRAYRIGQTRRLSCYDLVCKRSIDEEALANLATKNDLAVKSVKNLAAILRG